MNNHSDIAPYCNFLTKIIYLLVVLIPIQMVLFIIFPHPKWNMVYLYKKQVIINMLGRIYPISIGESN